MLFVFTLGLPISIAVYLFRHRAHLYSASVQQRMGWLWLPYNRGVEFWQVHDVVLKMVLTGLLIYIPMTARASAAVIVSVIAIANLNFFHPHKNPSLFWLTQMTFVTTMLKYLASLMLGASNAAEDAESTEIMGLMLVCIDVFVFVSFFVCLFLATLHVKAQIKKLHRVKQRIRTLAKAVGSHNGIAALVAQHKSTTGSASMLKSWTVPQKNNNATKVVPMRGGDTKKPDRI